jgi:hypothetical protein
MTRARRANELMPSTAAAPGRSPGTWLDHRLDYRVGAGFGARPGPALDSRLGRGADDRVELGEQTALAPEARPSASRRRAAQVRHRTARVISCRRIRVADAAVPARGPVRLTLRGRRVVVGAVGAIVVAGALIAGWSVTAALRAPLIPDSAPASVVVHPGDTLWSIAASVAPDRDPRTVVAALRERNGLVSSVIHSGQRLVVRQ